MHIESMTLTNFRCFGPEKTRITFGPDITALVGSNGVGKSALIEALRRLFGATRDERTLTRADVHFRPGENPDTISERQVVIDIVFAFPELVDDPQIAKLTIPEVFQVMTAAAPGEPLKARMRYEALWRRDESFTDDIEYALFWVTRLDEVEFGEEGDTGIDKRRVQSSDRNKIQLVYVPATRDGSAVVRNSLRQLLKRLERSGDYGADTESEIQNVSGKLQNKIENLPSIKWITKRLQANWIKLHDSQHLSNPRLSILSQDFVHILRTLNATLSPTPDGQERGIEALSEGQTSLFFIALSATLAQLEAHIAKGKPPKGFTDLDVSPPALNIYALEEPENHLAPYYLPRIIELLRQLCSGHQAMGIITSHSPSVLRRIDPESVRHLRLDATSLSTRVSAITLPNSQDEADKYVRQAVIAHPELYFAKIVMLGEGDSELIVLDSMAKAMGLNFDPSFITIAPLGGRHVNHFWKLLNDLNIPHLTLLDLDLGRHLAGPLRLKYAFKELRKVRNVTIPTWVSGDPNKSIYWKSCNENDIHKWISWFADCNIFFSLPLDFDMMMLRAFPKSYGVLTAPFDGDKDRLTKSIFGNGPGLEDYANRVSKKQIPTYNELNTYDERFKRRSKPTSHLIALTTIKTTTLKKRCPAPLSMILNKVNDIITK